MSLNISIPKTALEDVLKVEQALESLCEDKTVGELFILCAPRPGRLLDVLAILKDHRIPYELKNDDLPDFIRN